MFTFGIRKMYFKIEDQNRWFAVIFSGIYEAYSSVVIEFPITTFSVYYAAVCCQIWNKILNFSRRINKYSGINNDEVLSSYLHIKHVASFIDDKLSFFMFCTVAFTSINLYMAIYAILHMKPSSTFPPIRLTLLLNNIICFIVTTVAASLVSEASVLASAKARELSFNPSQKFLSCIDREISLTVWKIVPIRRSFPDQYVRDNSHLCSAI
ncbi:hypothetical protein CEXT_626771 [Caerostris extrusa]|uniref:Uncharacterized protein n=1 Tax=Caerostris extrusa TaxID=172846 RepID=A0AAV4ND91_CAEEX|nr:hypothetical protein CEXT_626771 [Caerostris extrusa]